MRNILLATAVALVATPAAAADISVSDAWVRLPAVTGRPAAGYLAIMGGAKPRTVVGITSPSAKKAEMHESRMAGGMMRMSPLSSIPVGKGAMVMLKPGGKHVMLFGLDPKIKPGATVRLDLKLDDGSTASVNAKAVGPADPAPSGDHQMEHNHNH